MLTSVFQSKGPSKAHWVPDFKATHCAALGCGKLFGTKIRRHHCRHCGLIFCDEHVSHRMRLNAEAQPDENGEMSKVCESCFSKQLQPVVPTPINGNNNVLVVHVAGEVTCRSRLDLFVAHRTAFNAEVSRRAAPITEAYEKARRRLSQLRARYSPSCKTCSSSTLSHIASQIRTLNSRRDRKQVVAWEPDSKIQSCRCSSAVALHRLPLMCSLRSVAVLALGCLARFCVNTTADCAGSSCAAIARPS